LLFGHRDAERETPETRYEEVLAARGEEPGPGVPVVCVVPVRMSEAWLLFDERAIRMAAGNPNGACPLDLPPLRRVEDEPEPKAVLYGLLAEASGLRGRRRKGLPVSAYAVRVPEFIDSFTPLRQLSAFRRLEAEVAEVVATCSWAAAN
jgi:hypothetical protein